MLYSKGFFKKSCNYHKIEKHGPRTLLLQWFMGGIQVNMKRAGCSSICYCELGCQILTANMSGNATEAVQTSKGCLCNKCNSAAVIIFTSPLRYTEDEDDRRFLFGELHPTSVLGTA